MSKTSPASYRRLEQHFAKIFQLRRAIHILQWDSATMMPPGAAEIRAKEIANLCVLNRELTASLQVAEWLAEAEEEKDSFSPWQQANIEEMKRRHLHAKATPPDVVERLTQATTACEMFWRTARAKNDFKGLLPYFQKVLKFIRLQAKAKAQALNKTPYDALLDHYEPGITSSEIDPIFQKVESFLPNLVQEVIHYQKKHLPALPLQGTFPLEKQRQLSLKIMEVLGFDFQHGRLDTSSHPFCGGTSDDVRITTRYNKKDFFPGLMGTIHETGHALYEFGLPKKWRFQPVGQARGMSLHESQSLLFERLACHSREFFRFLAPLVRKIFRQKGKAWEAENLYRLGVRVRRSLIRVEADEVTYPLHIILRYKLEKAMVEGELEPSDLPLAWKDEMKKLLGIAPPNDRNGCMQDIHWMEGLFGYFPTYTLGAMTAAQLYEAAVRKHPQIPQEISKGDFSTLLTWLRKNVHSKASLLPTKVLIQNATGSPLSAKLFENYLRKRYLA
ncbi:MAG: carboxypeptidase M32 [Planctomycetota bacterium]|nr:MAG: carboxypeptidase M32 [Planctomycetota bacterium]